MGLGLTVDMEARMIRRFGFSFAPLSGFFGARAAAGEFRQPRMMSPTPAAAAIQTARGSLGGGNLKRSLSRHGADTRAEQIGLAVSKSSGSPASTRGTRRILRGKKEDALFPLPRGSLIDPGSPPFKRHYLLQALIDVLAIGSAILLVTSVALSIPLSIFLIFFVDLR